MQDKYIAITHSFIRNKDLTMQEKIIFLEILNLSSLEHGCIATNTHFEKSFGIPKKSVSNTINSLVKKGHIESTITDRNHKRTLSIKNGLESINNGRVSIKNGESKENNTINNTISIKKESKKKKTSRFAPTSLEEVKSYIKEKNYTIDPDDFINFYESKGWLVGKTKMKDWKAAVRTWQSREKRNNHDNQQKGTTGKGNASTRMHERLKRSWEEELRKEAAGSEMGDSTV